MPRSRGICRDKGQADGRFNHARQFDLRLLGSFGQALQSLPVPAQINALLTTKLVSEPIDYALVKIIAAQVSVARGGFHFKDAFTHFEDRHVECATTQVENQYGF